jgi:hypothetical protein
MKERSSHILGSSIADLEVMGKPSIEGKSSHALASNVIYLEVVTSDRSLALTWE